MAGSLGLWICLSSFDLVNPLLLPSPLRVIGALMDIGPNLVLHAGATVLRVGLGFALGAALGGIIGIAMQYSRTTYLILDGVIETVRPVPPVAVVPFVILIFGFSEAGKLVVAAFGVSLVIAVTVVESIERIPTGVMRWGLVSGLSRRDLFRLVVVPAAWPEMRGGFRIGLALSITLVVVSEFLGATHGLGYLINVAKVTLTTPTIFLCVIILGWLGWALDRLLRLAFDKTAAWDPRAKGATL